MTTATQTETAPAYLVIDEEIRHQAHEYETASAYNVYLLQPGRYPFTLVTINHRPWVPGHVSAGYVKPGGPYYAKVCIKARKVEHYYVNRLWTASSITQDFMDEECEYTLTPYAYELGKRKTFFQSQARVELNPHWREDNYQCTRDLSTDDYFRMLSMAVWWLSEHGHGDYSKSPHWHVWNRVNAQAVGGVDGFVKAILEEWHLNKARRG